MWSGYITIFLNFLLVVIFIIMIVDLEKNGK